MTLVEIYRSGQRPPCDERAFVLHAVGIGSEVAWTGESWSLFVALEAQPAAAAQLRRYETENPARAPQTAAEPLHAHAWIGSAGYGALLLVVAYLAGHKTFGVDWLAAGVVQSVAIRTGEAWRAVTAVTLHWDIGHLLANLGFGAVFGLFAGQLLGPGVAWSAALAAAALANLANAWIQPAAHVSAGASTLVFAMLGLLSAYAWRRRSGRGERWAYRWAPLLAGIALLAFTGSAGERTDVLAHLSGFACGALAGLALARTRAASAAGLAQSLSGALALGLVAASWAAALAVAS